MGPYGSNDKFNEPTWHRCRFQQVAVAVLEPCHGGAVTDAAQLGSSYLPKWFWIRRDSHEFSISIQYILLHFNIKSKIQENPMIVAGANMSKHEQTTSRIFKIRILGWAPSRLGLVMRCYRASAGRFRELSRCQLPSYASYAQSAKCKARGRKLVED